jgi:hypothetical protein
MSEQCPKCGAPGATVPLAVHQRAEQIIDGMRREWSPRLVWRKEPPTAAEVPHDGSLDGGKQFWFRGLTPFVEPDGSRFRTRGDVYKLICLKDGTIFCRLRIGELPCTVDHFDGEWAGPIESPEEPMPINPDLPCSNDIPGEGIDFGGDDAVQFGFTTTPPDNWAKPPTKDEPFVAPSKGIVRGPDGGSLLVQEGDRVYFEGGKVCVEASEPEEPSE